MSDTGFSALDEELISAVAAGRGVLLLGQDHSGGLVDEVLRDVAAALRSDKATDLRSQLVDRVKVDDLPNVLRALSLHSADEQLIETVTQPWSMILTSAVDPMATEALRRAASSGRRLRILFPSQVTGQVVRVGPDTLTVLRLFGSLDEQERPFLPPLDSRTLRQRQLFEAAAVLSQLPYLLGPYGQLAVVGVGPNDWLDLEALALACSEMPPGSVHWFGAFPSDVEATFGESLTHHEGSFVDLIRRTTSSVAGEALRQARMALDRPPSRSLTVRTREGPTVALQLAPEDWRNMGQVGVLLADDYIAPPSPIGADEAREALRAFLRHQQYVPDWEAIGRGFLFERENGQSFLEQIEGSATALGSVRDDVGGDRRSGSRPLFLLTGPPACGKSRLLHWLAYQLRRRGHAVLYLVSPAGRVHPESVERACRLIEGKGAAHVIVAADGLDDASYLQLNEHLASSGRNAVVLGARSSAQRDTDADDPRQRSGFTPFRPLPVPPLLTSNELNRFTEYLSAHGFSGSPVGSEHMRDRYFLLLLYRLLPDARGNIHLSLGGEYDRLLSTLDEIQESDQPERAASSWKSQLEDVRHALFPDLTPEVPAGSSPLAHFTAGEHAVNLCLFCSQIGKPLPLELLLRTEGREFLRSYREFATALEQTALLHEVDVDTSGAVALDADHAIVAQLTLATVMPRRADQLNLLTALVDAVAWDEQAFPGDRPDQDYCIEVMQAVGPRGVSEREFQSPQSLQVIAELLARIRRDNGARLPRLLLLEANTLRFLADRFSADFETALTRCEEALRVLDDAEQILEARRPTVARNSEMRNVLNTRATVHGFIVGNLLRELRSRGSAAAPQIRRQIFDHLAEVDRLVARSRGLGDPSFHPLDVTFWVYRDTFEQLPDLTEEERLRLLARMEAVLDSATEEPIEADQLKRLNRRAVNLAQMEGNVSLSRELAATMREAGDFSGECLLIRRDAFDPGTRQPRSRNAAEAGLERLESFGPQAYESPEALDLMNLLWRAANLPRSDFGGADPMLASCTEDQWVRWRRILEARIRVAGSLQSIFVGFCLSWALFELGEARLGLKEIRAVEPLSGGSRRRVGCLVVLTDSNGAPLPFRAAVRRREGDTIVTYVSSLASEVRLAPALTSRFAVLPEVGDELELEVGLNYRGLLPWRVV